jgi:hypothetical protein
MLFLNNEVLKQCILLICIKIEDIRFALILNDDMPDWQELWFYKEGGLSFSACRSKRTMGINRTGAPAARRRAVGLQGQARLTPACRLHRAGTSHRLPPSSSPPP